MLIWGTKVQCFTRTKKWAFRFNSWCGLNKNLPLVGFVVLQAVNVVAAIWALLFLSAPVGVVFIYNGDTEFFLTHSSIGFHRDIVNRQLSAYVVFFL